MFWVKVPSLGEVAKHVVRRQVVVDLVVGAEDGKMAATAAGLDVDGGGCMHGGYL